MRIRDNNRRQRKNYSNNKIVLRRTAISAAVAATLGGPGYTQAQDSDGIEEIVVTGQRRALETARAIKRDADTFVDAISAADIGSLPDVSVLEALQRVPGITIERFAAPNDPDHFSTEGSGATLRGLPQTRSSFNGRDTFSANSSRGLSFQDVPPELMGSIRVFKNQTADMIEGGISGTIDLNTRKPFDAGGRVLAFAGQASYGDIVEETTPGFNGLYSDRFDVTNGELGVLLSYTNTSLDFRSDGVEAGQHSLVADVAGPGQDRYVPINGGIRSTTTEREREGIAASLQYANAAKSFFGTFEYIRSDSSNDWLEHAFFSDDNGGGVLPGATFSDTAFVSGTIGNVANGLGPQTRMSDADVLVQDFSLNLGFNPTARLSINADVQFVDATTDIVDLSVFGGLMPQGGGGIDIGLNVTGDVPDVSFTAPGAATQTAEEYYADPTNYFWRAAMDHIEESEGDEIAFRLDLDYELDSDWAHSVEAGVRFAERDQTTRWSNYSWGNLSEAWNGGFALFDGTRDGTAFGSSDVVAFSFDDFHGGNAGGIAGNPSGSALFPSAGLVSSYDAFLTGLAGFGRGSLADRGGTVNGGLYTAPEINSTNEQNTAVYVKLNFGTDGARRMEGNVGLRYVEVDTSVAGGVTFPSLNPNTAAFASPEELAFANGFAQTEDSSSSFSTVLPSLNVKYGLTDDLILRFGFSQAIAFPDLGNLRFNFNMSANTQNDANGNPEITSFQQDSGNPFLEPMEADNYDLSLEYYFGNSSFVSAGIFYKDIKNFFANDTVPTTVTNPSTGQSAIVDINQPINVGEATLQGFELSYQQFFDQLPGIWSGLGMQFNFTYLDEDGAPNQNTREVQADNASPTRTALPFEGLPLQGLSETSYNVVAIFENEKFESRLAYNWRDDYLLTIRQVNLGLPVFSESRGQLDGSAFYRINDNWQIGIQGTNLLKDETVTTMQVDQAGNQVFRSSFVFDRRYAAVVRGKF